MGRWLVLLCEVQFMDFVLSVYAVARYGPSVEVNPLAAGALSLGALGLLAWKCALLALILAAAALNPKRRRILLAGALLSGFVGMTSGVVALG